MKSTETCSAGIERLREVLSAAEAVLVGPRMRNSLTYNKKGRWCTVLFLVVCFYKLKPQ